MFFTSTIICDADLKILKLHANFGVIQLLTYALVENAYAQEENPRFWLTGDSGYPPQPWLVTLITNIFKGTTKRRYDDGLKTTRICVERCIGE